MSFIKTLFFLGVTMSLAAQDQFKNLKEVCPSLIIEANYSTINNFTGSVVPGYLATKAMAHNLLAEKICLVQAEALKMNLSLKIFDAYRPQKAVNYFIKWAESGNERLDLKNKYYPSLTRKELFDHGYIATRSSHSRGSAIDLTLVDLRTNQELDMGSIFDFFSPISHTDSKKISITQKQNRMRLKELMTQFGFKNFSMEWWHYSLIEEANPDTYFDFDVQ